jgi:hypothetical protein
MSCEMRRGEMGKENEKRVARRRWRRGKGGKGGGRREEGGVKELGQITCNPPPLSDSSGPRPGERGDGNHLPLSSMPPEPIPMPVAMDLRPSFPAPCRNSLGSSPSPRPSGTRATAIRHSKITPLPSLTAVKNWFLLLLLLLLPSPSPRLFSMRLSNMSMTSGVDSIAVWWPRLVRV